MNYYQLSILKNYLLRIILLLIFNKMALVIASNSENEFSLLRFIDGSTNNIIKNVTNVDLLKIQRSERIIRWNEEYSHIKDLYNQKYLFR